MQGNGWLANAMISQEEPSAVLERREFLRLAVGTAVAVGNDGVASAGDPEPRRIKAVAFDAFPIFDPRPISNLAEEMFPGKGAEFSSEWKTRQFEYTWLRTLTGQYEDFWHVTQDALGYAAAKLSVGMDQAKAERLMAAYLKLKAWPDVVPVLRSLKDAGIRLGFLSNFTEPMLRSCIESAGLNGFFEQILSTDRVKAFKPDRRSYEIGVEAFRLRKEEIAFAAFAGWDAVGAAAFGYPTFWVNRTRATPEQFGPQPNATRTDLVDLPAFIRGGSKARD